MRAAVKVVHSAIGIGVCAGAGWRLGRLNRTATCAVTTVAQVAGASETSSVVCAGSIRVAVVRAGVYIGSTFIDINTVPRLAIARKASIACACEATSRICASSIRITAVRLSSALVDVSASTNRQLGTVCPAAVV